MSALAVARLHSHRLPPGRRGRVLLRLGHRIAAGLAPARAAAAEGLPEARLDEVLADPAFAELVEACRRIRDLSDEERLARLERLALDALEVAMADADPRVMVCFVALRRAGLNPARVLAERVLRQDRRAQAALAAREDASPPAPAPCPPRTPRPLDPVAAALKVGAAKLRAALRLEHALHHQGAAPLPGPGGRPPRAAAPGATARGERVASALKATTPTPPPPRGPRPGRSRGGPARRRKQRAPPR